jgi:hypothetical protein
LDLLARPVLLRKQHEEIGEADDRDPLKAPALEAMPITGHDEIRLTVESALEDAVVGLVLDELSFDVGFETTAARAICRRACLISSSS